MASGASPSPFRQFLPDLRQPRFAAMHAKDAHAYAKTFMESGNPPWVHGLWKHWLKLYKEPFRGVTTDGKVRNDLFELQDEGVPIEAIVRAAEALLERLTPEQRKCIVYHVDAPEWRTWSNPEFLLSDKGVRLDEVDDALRETILGVLEASLSPEGYAKARTAMRVNGFLGELVAAPQIMNANSYNFVLFGDPSVSTPWGYSFYGHHLCLNAFFVHRQMVLAPWFIGAEPNQIDAGPFAGSRILVDEETLALQLMQGLAPAQQARTQVFAAMRDPAMPRGRWNHDDQRHLCGAYRDNRVVPYEGICVGQLDGATQDRVAALVETYLVFLPTPVRAVRLRQVRAWFHETYFCWIGGFSDADPFYYRLQSPILLVEFDHHSGVFLSNTEPAKFHIHTLLRAPNGGDYGMALRPLIPGQEQCYLWGQNDEEGSIEVPITP